MIKRKFNVVVHYEGAVNYEIEAETEEEANEKAMSKFAEEDLNKIDLADCEVCDCEEVAENGNN